MEALKAFFGGGGPKTPAFTPLPDRKPNVSAEQRAVPRNVDDIPERVLIHTTIGDITVSLFRQQTPRVKIAFPKIGEHEIYRARIDNILSHRPATTSPP
jgi:hypothetical protein